MHIFIADLHVFTISFLITVSEIIKHPKHMIKEHNCRELAYSNNRIGRQGGFKEN